MSTVFITPSCISHGPILALNYMGKIPPNLISSIRVYRDSYCRFSAYDTGGEIVWTNFFTRARIRCEFTH